MKQYNQSDKSLSWEMGGKSFSCEAYGFVDVPDELVPFARKRGLPLSGAPVAAEAKALRKAAAEKKYAEESDVIKMREQLAVLEASVKTAEAELDKERAAATKLAKKSENLGDKLREANDALSKARADAKALDAQLRDQATRIAELESDARTRVADVTPKKSDSSKK